MEVRLRHAEPRGVVRRRCRPARPHRPDAIAPSCRVPDGSPSGVRSMRPSAGSGVSRVIPASSSARELTQAPCPSRLVRIAGRSDTIGVERFLGRRPAGEDVHVPTAAQDPRRVGVGRGVVRDDASVSRRASRSRSGCSGASPTRLPADGYAHPGSPAAACVPPGRRPRCARPIHAWMSSPVADGHDRARLHGNRTGPAAGRVDRVHGAVDEHQIGRSVRVAHAVVPPLVESGRSILRLTRAPRAPGGRRSNSRASRRASSARGAAQALPRTRCRG